MTKTTILQITTEKKLFRVNYFMWQSVSHTYQQIEFLAYWNIEGNQISNFDSQEQEATTVCIKLCLCYILVVRLNNCVQTCLVSIWHWKRKHLFTDTKTKSCWTQKLQNTFLVGFRFTRTSCGAVLPIRRMGTAWHIIWYSKFKTLWLRIFIQKSYPWQNLMDRRL